MIRKFIITILACMEDQLTSLFILLKHTNVYSRKEETPENNEDEEEMEFATSSSSSPLQSIERQFDKYGDLLLMELNLDGDRRFR